MSDTTEAIVAIAKGDRVRVGGASDDATEDATIPCDAKPRCPSTLSGMQCELSTGHGPYHKHKAAGWEDCPDCEQLKKAKR